MAVPMKVELFHDGDWQDYTTRVRAADRIVINRGRPAFGRGHRPAECRLSLKNHDSLFSPRNPSSALHGKIGRGTRLRVSVDGEVRFLGAIPMWPVRSQGAGKDVWVPIVAFGQTHDLSEAGSRSPAQSAARSTITAQNAAFTPRAYWPLEAMSLSALGTNARPAVEVAQLGVLRAASSPSGSDGAVRLKSPDSIVSETVPYTGVFRLPLTYYAPASSLLTVGLMVRQAREELPAFDAGRAAMTGGFNIRVSGSVGALVFEWRSDPDVVVGTSSVSFGDGLGSGAFATGVDLGDGEWHAVRLVAQESSPNVFCWIYVDGTLVDSGTIANDTLGRAEELNDFGATYFDPDALVSKPWHMELCQVVVWDRFATALYPAAMVNGYAGETAAERIERVAGEIGVTVTVGAGSSAVLGPQPVGPGLEVMQDAADADEGFLLDARDSYSLTYRPHGDLLDQTPAATLDYAQKQLIGLDLDEDFAIANVYTVRRRDGGEATVEREDGPLGTGSPVGRKPQQATLTLRTDSQARQHAGWRSHVSTWDEPRVDRVAVDLTKLAAAGATTLVGDLEDVDAGDVIRIGHPPAWAGAGAMEFLVDGYTETIDTHRRVLEFHGHPAGPYHVGVLDGNDVDGARLDAAGIVLDEDLDASETSVDVDYSASVPFSSAAVPYDVQIGAEVMTVTAAGSPSGGTQTLTVTRGVNGVTQTHSTGDEVHIYRPLRLAREG